MKIFIFLHLQNRGIIVDMKPKVSYSPINPDTEEKIVAEETAWILQTNKKEKFRNFQKKRTVNKN